MTSISTICGGSFDYLDPGANEITPYSIAHGLSNTCRYSGQCEFFYSVGQHAILVSKLVPEDLAFEALHHDDSEAFLCDIPSPLKALLPDYRKIETLVEATIAQQLGMAYPMHPIIKQADKLALLIEQRSLTTTLVDPQHLKMMWAVMEESSGRKLDRKLLDEPLVPWSPGVARQPFLHLHEKYVALRSTKVESLDLADHPSP